MMEYIIALSKMLNFTKAAAAMCTTQPSFSRVISAAEEELGITLFERTRRHVRMTASGEAILPHLEQSVALYESGVRSARNVTDDFSGKLTVGYIPDAINQDIRLLTASFAEEHPDVRLDLRETHYYELQNQLINGQLDVAIFTSMQTNFPTELASRPLFETPLCAVVSSSHRLASRTSIPPEDLRDEPFVVLEHDTTLSGSWSFVHRFAMEYGFAPWIVSQTSMLSSALLQVSCDKGVCISSQFAGHLAPENVRIIPISDVSGCVRYAVWNVSKISPALSDFLSCIQQNF